MQSKEMIELIHDVEKNQHGISQMYASRIAYFQRTKRYETETVGCYYDKEFEIFLKQMEDTLGGKIYLPTAKKILNNWYLWAYNQRQSLLNLRIKNFAFPK